MGNKCVVVYVSKKIVPVFGGSKVLVEYNMEHTKYNRVNAYKVECEILGLETCDPHMRVYDVEYIGDAESTNDETLTKDGATVLFEETVGI